MTFDEIRRVSPELRFAVYAYDPFGGEVVFEILYPDGVTYTFRAATLVEALALAYPPPETFAFDVPLTTGATTYPDIFD